MKPTNRLTSFYTPIKDEKDAERALSDMSIFWYALGSILIIIVLIVTILTKEKVSLLFPLILVSAGYLLSRRKSRVLSSFILVYSLALIGVAIWFFNGSTLANFTRGLSSVFYNSRLIAAILFFSSYSLIILLLSLCSWAACRSVIATFVYHKKMDSRIFWRNIFFACGFAFVLPAFVPMPYAFSEIPWQHITYVNIYEYFTEELLISTALAVASIIIFSILTHYFPLVDWTNANFGNIKIQKRLASFYTPILNEKDAERVLSDLSIFWYAFAILGTIVGIINIIHAISIKKISNFILPIIFLFTGYFLPRRKSRVLSIFILIYFAVVAVAAVWYFLYVHPPEVGLWLVTIVSSLTLLIPLLAVLCTWAAYRSTMATFIYHRHYSQLKKISSSDKTRSLDN